MTVKTIPNDIFFESVEELIGEGKSVDIRVKGFSMRPFLRDGRDTVTLVPIERCALRVGMVALFRRNGRHILHRLRAVDCDRLLFEGDGNYRQTEECSAADVVAVVETIERGGRRIAYDSKAWRRLTRRSLRVKRLRETAIDIKRKLKI